MQFPTNVSIKVNNKEEYDELVNGLQGWVKHLSENNEDAIKFAMIIDRARYHDDKGIVEEIPESYVETGGRKIGSGNFTEMYELFQQEIAGHKAKVALYRLYDMKYKMVQSRG